MAKLLCCRAYQKAEIYKIVPTAENILDEYVLYLKSCIVCNKPSVEIIRVDLWGNLLNPVRLKTQNIPKFISLMSVLWKPAKLCFHSSPFARFALDYNEFGTKKKCYQNLSNLQVGKIETDPLNGLNGYMRAKKYVRTCK